VWKTTDAYKLLVGKPERNRPRGRPRCRWKGKVGRDLKEIWGALVDYIDLAEVWDIWRARAVVKTVMNFRIHKHGELLNLVNQSLQCSHMLDCT
jgi:hypothetical protein